MTINESVIRKTFQKNLVRLFDETGKLKKDLADYVGVSANTVTSWCAGQKVPRMDKLDMICNFFRVERSELLQPHEEADAKSSHSITAMDVIKIPLLGRVVAGDPREAIQEADEFLYIPAMNHRRSEDFFALRVCGESMEPNLMDGDIAIVHIQPDVESGQIAVVLIDNNDATVKRVFISEEGITLVADNPAVFSPRFFSNEDCAALPVKILGRVVSIQREM